MQLRWTVVGLAVLVAGLAWAQGGPTVWVASPWVHVLRDSPPGTDTTIRLQAAGNETESFRFIVRAGTAAVEVAGVTVSPLQGPGAALPAGQVALFREHYLELAKPSYRSKAQPGWYPDPLIPFVDPFTGKPPAGGQYQALPCQVAAGQNQGFWGDVQVPKGAKPGVYRGKVTVALTGQPGVELPLRLEVLDFSLPDTFSMRSNFGSLGRVVNQAGLKPGTPEAEQLLDRSLRLFLAHRCQPSTVGTVWPKYTPDQGMNDQETGERLRHVVEDLHVNSLALPFPWGEGPDKCRAYLKALAAYLRQKGWLQYGYLYLRDEPNNAEEYQTVREQGKVIREADPGLRRMCTEQTVSSNPAWGDLYGAVDIWCPLWGLWDEPTAATRLQQGEELWSYTALCQGPDGTPWWQVDFDPVMFRAPFWTSWRYGVTGFLYWSSTYWDRYDPWVKPYFRDSYWGEGILVYPGGPAGLSCPAPSIRLKLIREAMEDYEYMTLAAGKGHRAETDEIVRGVASSFQNWDRQPYSYQAARRQLADLITGSEGH